MQMLRKKQTNKNRPNKSGLKDSEKVCALVLLRLIDLNQEASASQNTLNAHMMGGGSRDKKMDVTAESSQKLDVCRKKTPLSYA